MRKILLKTALLLTAIGLLAGCKPGPTSETEKPLTEAEFALAHEYIAKTVPLVIEKTTGAVVRTNIYRDSLNPKEAVPILKGGNDISLTTGGNLVYEDEDNGVYLYPSYEITWSYLGQDDEASPYAKFEFVTDAETGALSAKPDYPVYGDELDDQGKVIMPPAKIARLYANLKIGEWSKNINIDIQLDPVEKVTWTSLIGARDIKAGTTIGVRGYVTAILKDFNSALIGDGVWGLNLYRLDIDFKDKIAVGDLVEVVGSAAFYNGLAQVSFIKSLTKLTASEWPEIKTPVVNEFTTDELKEQLELPMSDLSGPLLDKDSALVSFDKPFSFVRVEDRNGNNVGFAGFDTTGAIHTNVILKTTTSAGVEFEVTLAINYHMGSENQTAFKNFLESNATKEFNYVGPLGAYNMFNLGPMSFDNCLTLA